MKSIYWVLTRTSRHANFLKAARNTNPNHNLLSSLSWRIYFLFTFLIHKWFWTEISKNWWVVLLFWWLNQIQKCLNHLAIKKVLSVKKCLSFFYLSITVFPTKGHYLIALSPNIQYIHTHIHIHTLFLTHTHKRIQMSWILSSHNCSILSAILNYIVSYTIFIY